MLSLCYSLFLITLLGIEIATITRMSKSWITLCQFKVYHELTIVVGMKIAVEIRSQVAVILFIFFVL